jgi:hypothetical protein
MALRKLRPEEREQIRKELRKKKIAEIDEWIRSLRDIELQATVRARYQNI